MGERPRKLSRGATVAAVLLVGTVQLGGCLPHQSGGTSGCVQPLVRPVEGSGGAWLAAASSLIQIGSSISRSGVGSY